LMRVGGLTLRPGIAAMIRAARGEGLKLAVATTTSLPNVEALCLATFRAPAGEVFDVIAAGDMVARKKPAPDVFNLALRLLGVEARNALALEDSRNGLLAARATGLACIVSPGIHTQGEDFTGAVAVLDDFASLSSPAELRKLLAEAAQG
jgi:HAD superfamily hydrolase (TIGR01509 family)